MDLKDIVSARNNVRKNLKKQLEPRKTVVEEIVMSKQNGWKNQSNKSGTKKSKLKRYIND